MRQYYKATIRTFSLGTSIVASCAFAIATVIENRDRPLPVLSQSSKLLTAADYHKEPVDLKTTKSNEKLVAVESFKIAGESFYARTDKLNAPYYQSFASAPRKYYCASQQPRNCKK